MRVAAQFLVVLLLSVYTLASEGSDAHGVTADTSQALYKLPWEQGASHVVLQGNFVSGGPNGCMSGCYTHRFNSHGKEYYAWDFDLAEDTSVRAARGGRVSFLSSSYSPDHCGGLYAKSNAPPEYIVSNNIGNEANFVVIDHGDGTSALYLHLSAVSESVKQKYESGQPVMQGEELGKSGKTGFTQCDPHLHFQIEKSGASWYTQSVPAQFSDRNVLTQTPNGVPAEGTSYISDNGLTPSASLDWKNTTYTMTCDGEISSGFAATLTNGAATVSNPIDATRSFGIRYEAEAEGDLMGDGRSETAILLFCSPQPSNFYVEEVQVFDPDNKLLAELPSPTSIDPSGVLPPQYVPSELTISNGNIVAGMNFYGPSDNHATGPSIHRTVVWHWNGTSFTRVS